MCVIVIKPRHVKIDRADLRKMWNSNPHGAGFAYYQNNNLIVRKGFMEFLDLHHALDDVVNQEIVLHFRLATHGQVNEHQTHPFSIVRNVKQAKISKGKKTQRRINAVLFHNGVIFDYGTDKISDTLDFVVQVLSEVPRLDTRLKILQLAGSKYALMQSGGIHLVGDFFDYKKLKCSNLNWNFSSKHQIVKFNHFNNDIDCKLYPGDYVEEEDNWDYLDDETRDYLEDDEYELYIRYLNKEKLSDQEYNDLLNVLEILQLS